MNNIKIEELMKVRFDGIANRIGQLSKRESESLLLEHLEWLEGGWENEEIIMIGDICDSTHIIFIILSALISITKITSYSYFYCTFVLQTNFTIHFKCKAHFIPT